MRDEEPCCDGQSLKIPCCSPIPPFRLHYFLVLIVLGCFAFLLVDNVSPDLTKLDGKASVSGGSMQPPNPFMHKNVVFLVMVVCGLMILGTILHEGGHATATCCAPGGTVRHIMLNPCCGGHAFVGHTGGELWEAWVSFAGPMWDLSLFFLYYFILCGMESDGLAPTIMLHKPLSSMGFNVKDSSFQTEVMSNTTLKIGNATTNYKVLHDTGTLPAGSGSSSAMEITKHALDDSTLFWRLALAILMDWALVGFCFNMLPIITLDGADFFGSWVRLCSTPMISAVFIVITSLACIALLAIFQLVIPMMNKVDEWPTVQEKNGSKWRNPDVMIFLAVSIMVLVKLLQMLCPVYKLTCAACNDKLHQYHFTQSDKYERKKRDHGDYMIPQYGRAINY